MPATAPRQDGTAEQRGEAIGINRAHRLGQR
jgi:hypothetical protein